MQTVILAGGFGSRLSEETILKPKPMVEVGGKPILWHIMNIYSAHYLNEFLITLGYKSEYIKDYFINFYARTNDVSVDLATGKTTIHNNRNQPDWKIHLVETGLYTQTGGRLKRVQNWLKNDDTFMFTYGDGVADIDIKKLLKFHKEHGKIATVTTVLPPARFGRIHFEGNRVSDFHEKPQDSEGWINGGYFVLNREVFDYIEGDEDVWERGPLGRLTKDNQLMGYKHPGFWSPMDTIREKKYLEELWSSGNAPWKIWE